MPAEPELRSNYVQVTQKTQTDYELFSLLLFCFFSLYISISLYIMNHKQKAPKRGQIVHPVLSTNVLRETIADVRYTVVMF